jgi:hypothetical protein
MDYLKIADRLISASNVDSAPDEWPQVKPCLKGLLAEIASLKQQLEDARELPTIAAMWAHHNRDDEVRELRAMCDELATCVESSLNGMAHATKFYLTESAAAEMYAYINGYIDDVNVKDTLARYRATTTNKGNVDND